MKQVKETMAMLEKKGVGKVGKTDGAPGTENEVTTKALAGDIDMECPSPAKIVRIFTSSTFTGKVAFQKKYKK